MYLPKDGEREPLTSEQELVAHFRAAGKPADRWLLGIEHEMIGVYTDGTAPTYEGPRGIGELLTRVATEGDWTPVTEDGHVIALTRADGQITLEPGGQLELAARPVSEVSEIEDEVMDFGCTIDEPSEALGIVWLDVGFRPFGTIDDVSWMPKRRYGVMRNYLPTRGGLAHEMMKRTATVQVNIDFSDSDDAGRKLRCANTVMPIFTALYANSPIVDGKITDFQSYRAHVWTDTDPDRCGLLPFVFDDGDIFEAYTQWALDVPMFFVHRGDYLPAGGLTFRQFMRDGFGEARATMNDWELHLSTLFPEARLKSLIELRSCDSGSRELALALGPLVRGLFYDRDAAEAAIALGADKSITERNALLGDVARVGLAAPFDGPKRSVRDAAAEMLRIADDGLARLSPGDRRYLDPLREVVETGRTGADHIVEHWRTSGGDPAQMIPALAHPGLDCC